MSAPSPLDVDPSLVGFTIEIDGAAIASDLVVVSIDTWVALGKVPRARVVIFDGSPAQGNFPLSETSTFVPGKQLTIAAGWNNGKESVVFRGLIVKQGLEARRDGSSRLVVEASDEAIRMTLQRNNGVFENVRDSELISELIKRNGLKADVAATSVVHEEVVQYYASDWDLMMTRAEINGQVVLAQGGTVRVAAPDTAQNPVLAVRYGDSILELSTEMDAATQLASSAITSTAWDPQSQTLTEAGPGRVTVTEPGNLSSADLAKVFSIQTFLQQTGGPIEKAALEAWSSAELVKSQLSKIRGSVRFIGSALAEPGKTIQLEGLGARFNGKALISGVHHAIQDGEWTTTVDLGLPARWFAATAPDIAAPGASGQLPPIAGLQTGIVQALAKDPGGEHRVLVTLPILRDKSRGVWARLAAPYASNLIGVVFYPEIGDEVVVGFMNDDPRYPVIVGSVFSQKLAPPFTPDEKNTKKTIVTRSKLEISFDDANTVLTLKTPGGHLVELDDKTGSLTVRDKNGSSLVMSSTGVALASSKDLQISAQGAITIDAGTSLALGAKTNATLDANQVSARATGKLSASANAGAELKSTGILTLRGSLVKIN